MKAKDIKPCCIYSIKNNPYKVLVIKILGPKKEENITNHTLVKCIMSSGMSFDFGLIKYIRPSDFIKDNAYA